MAEKVGRSLRLSIDEQEKATSALAKFGSKSDLAAELEMSRTTLNKFFKGEPVQRKQFHAICKKLQFDWRPQLIAKLQSKSAAIDKIETLVQQVRSRLNNKIITDIGQMMMLRVGQVPVDEIYINLNLLEQPSCDRPFFAQRDQLQSTDDDFRSSFERVGVGAIQEKQVPALEVVQAHRKLMVLGKPGAGKTTLLKSLAVQCIHATLPWQEPLSVFLILLPPL